MASNSHLLQLPAELQLQIVDCLSFPDSINLKLSCKRFHILVSPATHEELLEGEDEWFALRKDVLACRFCLRLRPRARFATAMTRLTRLRGGAEAHIRSCIDCGKEHYSEGDRLMLRDETLVFCINCDELKSAPKSDAETKECQTCWDKAQHMRAIDEVRRAREMRAARVLAEQRALTMERRLPDRLKEPARRRGLGRNERNGVKEVLDYCTPS